MLVLSRRRGEQIVIGDGVKLSVARIRGGRVQLVIEAPDDLKIVRKEIAGFGDLSERTGCLGASKAI